jgi:hypothetical protein
MRTSELQGAALDWAVAKCESLCLEEDMFGLKPIIAAPVFVKNYKPSTDWSQGGPIIEREKIAVAYEPSLIYDDSCRWKALSAVSDREHEYGHTPLIAAMRCYVASKLGEDIDIPEELK